MGFDAPLSQSQSSLQQNIQLLPDVTMEWLINQSGTIRASFFYRENTDYLTNSSNTSTATGLFDIEDPPNKKDFDRLGDLFRRKKKVQQPAEAEQKTEAEKKPTGQL